MDKASVYYKGGSIYVVFEDDRDKDGYREIYFALSQDTGKTWSKNKLISKNIAGLDEYYPWITVDKNNVIHVVWQGVLNGVGKIYYTKSIDNGNTFLPPDTLPGVLVVYSTFSNVNFGPQPKIESDPKNGYLYVVWTDDRTGNLRIRLAKSTNGGSSFTDLGTIDHNPNNVNRQPSLAIDDSGYIHVVWARGTSGNNQDPKPFISYNFSKDGINWLSNDIIVNDNLSSVYRGNPSITINRVNGNVIVAWEDSRISGGNTTPDIFFAKKKISDNQFSQNLKANINSGTSNFKPKFFVDKFGKGLMVWHSNYISGSYFSIMGSAYSDSLNNFSISQLLFPFDTTFTGTSSANFGDYFYPPALYTDFIDSSTNFFLVWQDLKKDPLGDIYFLRGKVIISNLDLDIVGDSLHYLNFGLVPGDLWVKKTIRLYNTDSLNNPDKSDGPSKSIAYKLRADSVVVENCAVFKLYSKLPDSLLIGKYVDLDILGVIRDGCPYKIYYGTFYIYGNDKNNNEAYDTVGIYIIGPKPLNDLSKAKVYPNPFKPYAGHKFISFTNLTDNSRIDIFDVNGNKITTLYAGNDGSARWDGNVPSGVYTYVITDPNGNKTLGKIAIIR